MVLGVWLLALTVFLGVWLLYWLDEERSKQGAVAYRAKYLKMVGQLERLVFDANALSQKVFVSAGHTAPTPVNGMSQHTELLDSYLAHLKMLEHLMEAIRLLPPFALNVSMLQAPAFLVKDTSEKFQVLRKGFDDVLSGKNRRKHPRFMKQKSTVIGCYFCSRPFDPHFFHKVRVKLEGVSQDVAACKTCNHKLVTGKKAKVLYFSENGQSVHWSEASDYTPSAQFWNINDDDFGAAREDQRASSHKSNASHLTLVFSQVTPLSSKDR